MARPPKPHRGSRNWWRYTIAGRTYWHPPEMREEAVWRALWRRQRDVGQPHEPATRLSRLCDLWEVAGANAWAVRLVRYAIRPLGNPDPAKIDSRRLAEYVRQLQARGQSPRSVRHSINCLRQVLRWAVQEGQLKAVPAAPRMPRAIQRPRDVEPEQVRKVLAAVRSPAHKLLRFIWWTGCRPGEACRLRWGEVDLRRAVCLLADHKTAQTAGRMRTLYLPPRAIAMLRRLGRRGPTEPVFLSVRDRPYTPAGLRATLRSAARHVGVPLTPYQLRHSAAVWALDHGLSPELVARMLGHEALGLVWTYARIRDERVRAAVAALPDPSTE